MKTLLLSFAIFVYVSEFKMIAGEEPKVVASTTVSARDGFTRGSAMVLFTWKGNVKKVEKDVLLSNGLRVQSDGTVFLPNGDKTSLKNNQLLNLDGTFEDVALTPDGLAPVTTAGSPPAK
jgi:hypothetical protein